MSVAKRSFLRQTGWRQTFAVVALMTCPYLAQAAGGVLDGKLADSALADYGQRPDKQIPTKRLNSHLADQALADLPWSPPSRAPEKRPSAFAGLQDSLRDAPQNAGRRANDPITRRPDLTSVLADLKNDAMARGGNKPQRQSVTRQIDTESTQNFATPNAPIATNSTPPVTTIKSPSQHFVVPPPQHATTGVLTGLRLLPPDQPMRKAAPIANLAATSGVVNTKPKSIIALQPQAHNNPASDPMALSTAGASAHDARIVIEVLPPPPYVATETSSDMLVPTGKQANAETPTPIATVTGILTGLRLLPAASTRSENATRTPNKPPQAFRSSQPPDKMPLFITARSGETVKLAPTKPGPLARKALADEALAAYEAVTPPTQLQQPLRFNDLAINLAVSPSEEAETSKTPIPATKTVASSADTPQAEQKKNENDTSVNADSGASNDAVPLTGDHATTDVRQELWKEWSEKVILLEQENKALRGELSQTKADPLRDIRVDAVAKIKEQVLRERIMELEKEVLEAQNKAREAALNEAAKRAADASLMPPPGAQDLPIKP